MSERAKSRISPKFLNWGTVFMGTPFTEIRKQGEDKFLMEKSRVLWRGQNPGRRKQYTRIIYLPRWKKKISISVGWTAM